MKPLIRIVLVLAVVFASTFVLTRALGLVTIEGIESLIETVQAAHPIYGVLTVVGLLVFDLFFFVPTLTVIVLGGFFLGPVIGGAAAVTGLGLAGLVGYVVTRIWGDAVIRFIVRDPDERARAKDQFRQYGVFAILLSRAMPILPEISACMAGASRMPLPRFLAAWLTSTVPYALIAAYAGSISTLENPMPAILAVIGLTFVSWLGWFLFVRHKKRVEVSQ